MKFKLPRQIINQEICKIISKEVRKQGVDVLRASNNNLRELIEVSRAITEHGLLQNLLRKKLPGGLGYGIFLHPRAKPILKGQIIAPYAGEVSFVPRNLTADSLYAFEPLSDILLSKDEQSRFHGGHRYHPRRFYSMHVDALKKGNFTRFINHSEKPNVIAELFRIPPNSYGLIPSPLEVLYLAKKTIRPGEQLLVCYDGDDHSYWGALETKPIPITPKTFQLDSSLKVIGSLFTSM
jgi:hypothetical protein